jgi:hypothetical protein
MVSQREIEWINSRCGLPPTMFEEFVFFQNACQESRRKLCLTTTAVTRLKQTIKQQCEMARVQAVKALEGVWVWQDAVVFEVERAFWDDVPGSGDWLMMLRKIYVVDSKRNMGWGTRFVKTIQAWCENAGAAICLICCPFGLSRNETDRGPFYLQTLREVLDLWETGAFHKQETGAMLRQWYLQRGFRNANLLDGNFFKFREKYECSDQFIFVPDSLDGAARQSASHRLRNE